MSKNIPNKPTPHGTYNGYQHYKCRCDLCKKAAADYTKQYRENNREWFIAYSRQLYRERADFIDSIKMDSGCVDCGFNKHPACLQFDHIPGRGEKLFAISSNKLGPIEKIIAEIAKCEVVCANCHVLRTLERGQFDSFSYKGEGEEV